MKRIFLFLVPLFLFTACKEQTPNNVSDASELELKKLQAELAFCKKENQQLKVKSRTSGLLTHTVFLKRKDNLTKPQIVALSDAIDALKGIDFLQDFHVGRIANTGDIRFISDHDVFFSFSVKNQEEMDAYQKHPIHLTLKKVAGKSIVAPPKVYDYWVE